MMTGTQNTGSGLGILLGILGLVWLADFLSKKKCPYCGCENPPQASKCYLCGGNIKKNG